MINVLMTLAILVALAIGLAALIPVLTLALAFVLVFGGFLIWLLPILIIAFSDRTTGGEKLAWILAIVFLSWFAWIFYFLLAPIKAKEPYGYAHYRDEDYDRDDYRDYRYY